MPEPLGVDLVELSGGGYESPAMTGRPADDRTRAREACFLDLAEDLVRTSPVPLMLTGGITRRATAETVLGSGVAVVGMGTALVVTPDLPDRWKRDREAERQRKPVTWPDKTLASATGMAAVRHRMRRLARGRNPRPGTPRRSPSSPSPGSSGRPCAATAPGRPRRGPAAAGEPSPGDEGRARRPDMGTSRPVHAFRRATDLIV
ncbi:hypothetical protein [Streptomyces vietnamensis]|uniref:hypothetical protein n=1 Tax=Streptomyces vietnamensis TaxID=362257 RepID=UPI0034386E88